MTFAVRTLPCLTLRFPVRPSSGDPRRGHRGPGALDRRPVGPNGRGAGVRAGPDLLGLLFWNQPPLEQPGVASGLRLGVFLLRDVLRQIGFRLGELRLVPGQIRQRLRKLRLQETRIHGEEEVPPANVITFAKGDLGQFSADLCLDRDGQIGFHVADHLEVDRDVPLRDSRHDDGHTAALSLLRRRGFARAALADAAERQNESRAGG